MTSLWTWLWGCPHKSLTSTATGTYCTTDKIIEVKVRCEDCSREWFGVFCTCPDYFSLLDYKKRTLEALAGLSDLN